MTGEAELESAGERAPAVAVQSVAAPIELPGVLVNVLA